MSNNNMPEVRKVTFGSFIALAFAIIFFSGLMQSGEWWGVLDFNTLNGSFGQIVGSVQDGAEGVETVTTNFRGRSGSGARDGFMFAITLIPTVMFALGIISVLEHYGALDAARKLMTPLLRPVIGIPGDSGLALIASMQSTDAGASMTRNLMDNSNLSKKEGIIFSQFQMSAGATITNFFSSGAILFALTNPDGTQAIPVSIGLCIVVMFALKIFGANVMRLFLRFYEEKESKETKAVMTKGAV